MQLKARSSSTRGKLNQGTRQVNLALTATQEELARLLVLRLREGGVEYEARVREFLEDPPVPKYMHVDELDRRFGAIERRLMALEHAVGDKSAAESAAPAEQAQRDVPRPCPSG